MVLAAWMNDGNLDWKAAAAVFAILGHVFTVRLRFKGGKGVAIGCGAFLALSPLTLLATLGCFALILILTRYVSAAWIGATILFPLLACVFGAPAPLLIGEGLGAVLIIARHYQNIQRLLSGKENRLALKRRS